jgi:transcriptional regulator with XRE-family HTH domain
MEEPHSKNNSERTLGQVLRRGREAAQLTIRQLAAKIGVHRGYLSKLERDFFKRPNLRVLAALAEHLGLDYAELVTLTGQVPALQPPSLPRYIVNRYDVTEEQAALLAKQWQQVLDEANIHERSDRLHFNNPR